MDQIRVILYKNVLTPKDAKNVLVDRRISKPEMLTLCSESMGISAKKVFNDRGVDQNSFEGLADGAVLYISQGEPFQVRKSTVIDTRICRKFALAILGAAAVGKSAITLRYVYNKFVTDYDPTIEDFHSKTVQIDSEVTQLSILDTAGMEDYEVLINQWIEKKDALVLVFNVQAPDTVQRVRELHEKILHCYEMKDPRKAPVIVIAANKIDLPERHVRPEEGRQLSSQLNVPYFEVSAHSNINIEEMFAFIVRELRKKRAVVSKANQGKKWWQRCQLL